MPRHSPPYEKVRRAKYAHQKKRGERSHKRGRRAGAERPVGIPGFDSVEEWIRYELDARDARLAYEAAAQPLPPLPVFRARNLAERVTLMLYAQHVFGMEFQPAVGNYALFRRVYDDNDAYEDNEAHESNEMTVPPGRGLLLPEEVATGLVSGASSSGGELLLPEDVATGLVSGATSYGGELLLPKPVTAWQASGVTSSGGELVLSEDATTAQESDVTSAGDRPNYDYIALTMLGGGAAAAQAGPQGITDRLSAIARTGGLLMAGASALMTRRGAGIATGASALLGSLAYASYLLFGNRGGEQNETPLTLDELAELTGALTEDERALVEELYLLHETHISQPEEETYPFSESEIAEIEQIAAELEAEFAASVETPVAHSRSKRWAIGGLAVYNPKKTNTVTTTRAPVKARPVRATTTTTTAKPTTVTTPSTTPSTEDQETRQEYWSRRYEETAEQSPEKFYLNLLRNGGGKNTWSYLVAPRESFPLNDTWVTRMDALKLESLPQEFSAKIALASQDAAKEPNVKAGIAQLPDDKWLHLGKYYLLFYQKVMSLWANFILNLEVNDANRCGTEVDRLQNLTGTLNKEFDGAAIDAPALKKLSNQGKQLKKRNEQLRVFSTHKSLSDSLKNDTLIFSPLIPKSEAFWKKYSLAYIDKIDPSKFTADFRSTLFTFVTDLVDQTKASRGERIVLGDLYSNLSILTLERLKNALQEKRGKDAYNYAVLDEQVVRIIRENIVKFWHTHEMKFWLGRYNTIRKEIKPLLDVWLGKVAPDKSTTPTKSPTKILVKVEDDTADTGARSVSAEETTAPTSDEVDDSFNWAEIGRQAEAMAPLPEPFSVRQYALNKLEGKLDTFLGELTGFLSENIFSPDRYIDTFIRDSLNIHRQDEEWSPDSQITVNEIIYHLSDGRAAGVHETIPHSYSLRDIARGKPRKDLGTSYSDSNIQWPASFSEQLRHRLLNIDLSVDLKLDALFGADNPEVKNVYKVMTTRAAMAYLDKKRATPGGTGGEYHQHYIDAVKQFLKGETQAETVEWHGSTLTSLIFIPVPSSKVLGDKKIGVLLSLWDNDYFDVPWPGLAELEKKEGEERKIPPSLTVESSPEFRTFIERYRTVGTGKALKEVPDSFGFLPHHHDAPEQHPDFTFQTSYTVYNPPFTTTAKSRDALIDKLIQRQRNDLSDLYDELINSAAEHQRAVIHELVNTLAVMSGLLLMAGGIVVGGPALPWIAASMATTLLLEVVPNIVLYSQADDDEERKVYMRSMIMAVAFELGGSLAGVAMEQMLRGVSRLTRLAVTALPDTLPGMYKLLKNKVLRVIAKTGVRRLRLKKDVATAISQEGLDDLDQIVRALKKPAPPPVPKEIPVEAVPDDPGFNYPPGARGGAPAEAEPVAGPSGRLSPSVGIKADLSLEGRIHALSDVISEMDKMRFESNVRIVTAWKKGSTTHEITNSYYIRGLRRQDHVVVQLFSDNGEFSYVYFDEDEWLQIMANKAQQSDDWLLAYYDLASEADLTGVKSELKPLTQMSGSLPLEDYPKDGVLLYASKAYKDMVAKQGVSFDAIQKFLDQLHIRESSPTEESSLSTIIKNAIEGSDELQSSLRQVSLFDEIPKAWKAADADSAKLMKRIEEIKDLGPDITHFRPLVKDLPFRQNNPQLSEALKKLYTKTLHSDPSFKVLSTDFSRLKAKQGGGMVSMTQLNVIEQGFNRVFDIAEKVQALMVEAKSNSAVHERILVLLAKFLNTTDSKILGEAFERLTIMAERLRDFARYHVQETKLGRVVVMKKVDASEPEVFAYVYQRDPTARIMVVLPDILEDKAVHDTIIHEISHQAIGTDDFMYLTEFPKKYSAFQAHHISFGTYPFEPDSAHVPLGRAAQSYGTTGVERLKPLSDYDLALAQARVRFLPMERANAKMGNADSQVILLSALINNFDFEKVMFAGTGSYTWRFKVIEDAVARAKRDVAAQGDIHEQVNLPEHTTMTEQSDIPEQSTTPEAATATVSDPAPLSFNEELLVREYSEHLLAAMLAQANDFEAGDALTEEEIEKLGLLLTEIGTTTPATPGGEVTDD
ncbi:Dermonecrotoxin of the Papain-like fold [Kosakonia sp. AX9b]